MSTILEQRSVGAASQPLSDRPFPGQPRFGAAPLAPQHENHESDANDAGNHAGYDKKADAARHENGTCQIKQSHDQGKKHPRDYIGAKVGEERLANCAFYAAPNDNPHKQQDQGDKQLADNVDAACGRTRWTRCCVSVPKEGGRSHRDCEGKARLALAGGRPRGSVAGQKERKPEV